MFEENNNGKKIKATRSFSIVKMDADGSNVVLSIGTALDIETERKEYNWYREAVLQNVQKLKNQKYQAQCECFLGAVFGTAFEQNCDGSEKYLYDLCMNIIGYCVRDWWT